MITVGSVQELLARASWRQRVQPDDARAGAVFERVTVGLESFFVKQLSVSSGWIMRIAGDHVHRPYLAWQAGILDLAPDCVDHAVVAMDLAGQGDDAVLTIVMRDVGGSLVPPGGTVVPAAQHARFISHMADLASAFWGWEDRIGLTTMGQRLRFFAPDNIAAELTAAEVPGPLAAAVAGWPVLAERSPLLSAMARRSHDDPGILTARLSRLPGTFLHGDWKMGNLGSHPDGRTILLDWTLPGAGPACWDLCWYLALNRARLPEQKEAAIGRARRPRDRHGKLVAGTARPVPDGNHGHVRLGEGARRRRRAVLVGGPGRRRRRAPGPNVTRALHPGLKGGKRHIPDSARSSRASTERLPGRPGHGGGDGRHGNRVVAYHRAADGTLTSAGSYATGGRGGILAGSVVDHTASQGSLAYDPAHARSTR